MSYATVPAGSGGGNLTATYLIKTADATLTNAQVLGSLATGIMMNTTTTGAQSIATLSGLTLAAGTLSNDLLTPQTGNRMIYGSSDAGGTLGIKGTSHANADGIVSFGTAGTGTLRLVDSTTAVGGDYSNFFAGKTGLGMKQVLGLSSRGASLGDDIYIAFEPAGGGALFGTSKQRLECLLLGGSVYQFRFQLQNASAVMTEVLRLDGSTAGATFFGDIAMTEAKNLVLGTTTGTKIGTTTSQKLGFWNATPVVQQTRGATLTNNVTDPSSTTDATTNWTDLVVYANDATPIKKSIFQLARIVALHDGIIRSTGLAS